MGVAADATAADRIEAMLTEHLALGGKSPAIPFDWGAGLRDDLEADSLDMVELAMALEEAFNLEIVDETVDAWKTPADMRESIEQLLARGKEPA